MLNALIALALRHRLVVAIAAAVLLAFGIDRALRLPIDVLPDLTRPTVTILTECHGMTPESIERLVTRPIEQAVNGTTGITRLRSTSGLGLSSVQVEFGWDTDVYRNRQLVQEKLGTARSQLPAGLSPEMAPVASIMGQILLVGVRSRSGATSIDELRALVDRTVRLRLLAIQGVAQVTVNGGAARQLLVDVDGDALRAHGVTIADVAAAVGASSRQSGGGPVALGTTAPIVHVAGLADGVDDVADALLRDDPVRPLRVRDVASVAFGGAAIRVGDAGVDGKPAVVLAISKQPDIDTLDLTRRIDASLAGLAAALPEDVEVLPSLYRQSEFIERAVHNVADAVRDGAILVVLVLFLFLANLRTTLITLTALPVSVAVTTLVFWIAGISINTMTLGGLAVAVGALVDDAIVDVENVFRRMRQNAQRATPRAVLDVVFAASSEVRKPILIGTLVVVAVYLPLFGLSGIEGRLFAPIGVTYILSVLASMVVSLTLTPVLCSWLLPGAKAMTHTGDGPFVRFAKRIATACVTFSVARARWVVLAFAALVPPALLVLATRGSEFLPAFQEGSVQVNLFLPPGTSVATSDAYGRRLEQIVADVDGVASIARRTGRAANDDHVMDVNVNEAVLNFAPESTRGRAEILTEIRERVHAAMPGVSLSVEQPLAHLLSHMLSGVYAQVAVKVHGPEWSVLRKAAREIAAALRSVPGVTDLFAEPQVLVDQIDVRPRRDDLARLGLDVASVADVAEISLQGREVATLQTDAIAVPVVVRLAERFRADVDAVSDLALGDGEHGTLRLRDVADVVVAGATNTIQREDLERRIVVQHNVEGRSLGAVVADVETALAPIRARLASGYGIAVGGQYEAQQSAERTLVWMSALAFVAMAGIVWLHFRSIGLTLQTLVSLPAAFLGGIAFIVLTGQEVSIATLVGLISLGGIAVRNSILLIDHYRHLLREEGEPFGLAMLVRAGQERIVPVAMTALTSGIALLPIVLVPDLPGREILYPVASVIVGGLVTSTLLDLLLTPGLFWLLGPRGAGEAVVPVLPMAPVQGIDGNVR